MQGYRLSLVKMQIWVILGPRLLRWLGPQMKDKSIENLHLSKKKLVTSNFRGPCSSNLGLRVRRSNFMRSKLFFSWDQIHEVKFFPIFHEVEIRNNDSISWSALFHEIKIQIKALLGNFDLMINFLVASTIMRSKFKKALLGISISWSIC